MKKTLIACLVGPSMIALPAFAGNLEEPVYEEVVTTPAPTPAPGYDWTGFYGGLSLGTGSGSIDSDETGETDFDVSDSYGLHGGYLWDQGTFVYGGELEYSSLSLDEDGGDESDADVVRLKGRLGYDAGRFMPYATGGFANLNTDDDSGSGYVLGVGAEFAATDSIRVRGEYLNHQFNDFGDAEDADVNVDTFNIGLSYAF